MSRSFEELFACGPNYSLWTAGDWNDAGKLLPLGEPKEIKGEVRPEHWEEHAAGKRSLIVSPTLSDRTALFGVIDVDPIKKVDRGAHVARDLFDLLHSKELPFSVCESKSNGAHAYIFLADPEDVAQVSKLLFHIVEKLDIGKRFKANIDIRPSASRSGGGAQIQLPYFGDVAIPGASSPRAMPDPEDPDRYLTRDEFIQWVNVKGIVDFALLRRQVVASLGQITGKGTVSDRHDNVADYGEKAHEGPPCYEKLMLEVEGEDYTGSRNNMLFHLAARLPMMFDDNWEQMIKSRNYAFAHAISDKEITNILRAGREGKAGLMCNADFAMKHCDKTQCKVRRFGILAKNTVTPMVGCEVAKIVKFRPPDGENQREYPVHIYLEGRDGYIATDQEALVNFTRFATDVFHYYKFHLPHMNQKGFSAWINSVIAREDVKFFEVPMPREMTMMGRFERAIKEHIRTMLFKPGSNTITRDMFARGTVYWDADIKALVFDQGVMFDAIRNNLKDPKLNSGKLQELMINSDVLAKGSRPWKAFFMKHGLHQSLTHITPRWEGDGETYTDDEKETLWFDPPSSHFE